MSAPAGADEQAGGDQQAGPDEQAGGDQQAGPDEQGGGNQRAGSGEQAGADTQVPAPRHVYIHVPFCTARCDYCEFYSVAIGPGGETDAAPRPAEGHDAPLSAETGADAPLSVERSVAGLPPTVRERLLDRFVTAVGEEWRRERERLSVCCLETVFIGGGTPSRLGWERLERLLEPFEALLTPRAEVTVEVNPDDVTPAFAAWAAARRLRVSLGVQSFDARLRGTLGRRAAADPEKAFVALRDAGVGAEGAPGSTLAGARARGRPGAPGLGVDLIFGLPGQRLADVEADLATVARLRPDHVSWYELGVVPGSALAARLARYGDARLGREAPAPRHRARSDHQGAPPPGDHTPTLPDDDAVAVMYRRAVAGLGVLGFDWYEVSNFARPGRRCRHNSAVWRGRDYLGLGPGAVGTVGLLRRRDLPDVAAYLAALEGGADPPRGHERLNGATRARERLLLAARTGERVALDELDGIIDQSALAPLAAAGLVSLAGGTLRVTRKGRYVANGVCVRLFRDSSFLEA